MAKEVHTCVLCGNLDSHIAISNALIDVYGKSGNLAYSRSVFNCMSSKDIITWNSIIAGNVLHGHPNDALDTFDQMTREGHRPNRGTFISLLLAYSRAKMVEKGKQVFWTMTRDYCVVPDSEHYAAMIDLFGRSFMLKEAIKFINCMEMEPESPVWDALFTASRSHGNIALTIHSGDLLELNPGKGRFVWTTTGVEIIVHVADPNIFGIKALALLLNPGNGMLHNLVSKAYMVCGRSVDTLKEHRTPGNNDVKKLRACSLLELKNQVYSFVSGDHSTPGLKSLSTWLQSIAGNIKLPVKNHHVHKEDSEEISGLHSEKLALAFALLSTDFKATCIRIVKNFRTCEDCHCTAKYISSAYGCEIYLSDTECLHHFKNGHCSCGDYW